MYQIISGRLLGEGSSRGSHGSAYCRIVGTAVGVVAADVPQGTGAGYAAASQGEGLRAERDTSRESQCGSIRYGRAVACRAEGVGVARALFPRRQLVL